MKTCKHACVMVDFHIDTFKVEYSRTSLQVLFMKHKHSLDDIICNCSLFGCGRLGKWDSGIYHTHRSRSKDLQPGLMCLYVVLRITPSPPYSHVPPK